VSAAVGLAAADGEAPVRGILRVNPVAKVSVTLIIGISLVLTLDWVSAAVALGLEVLLLPFAGLALRRLLRRAAPLFIAAPLVTLTIALYGRTSGHSWFSWLLIDVSTGSLTLAIATGLRILAIALPAIVLFSTIEPTELADGLAQVIHLPARFVLGALAAFRLVGLLTEDWRSLERARRARGVGDRHRIQRLAGQAFALLVLAIRRATKLATAMEARGFGAETPRTWAREARFGRSEWLLISLGLGIAAAAIAVSAITGHWNLFGRS
jgi:energy-coupling factor transport system permease protein